MQTDSTGSTAFIAGRPPTIVVLDGHTLNPGDNPWDPVAALGDLRVYDRTSEDEIAAR